MGVASDTLASISRAQWEDYKARFVPLENQLIAGYNNAGDRATQMNSAVNLSGQAFDAAAGVQSRNLSRYGVDTGIGAGATRSLGLGKAAATVDAMNTSRQHMNDRDQILLTGGISSRGV
jgi:hypothetical protein